MGSCPVRAYLYTCAAELSFVCDDQVIPRWPISGRVSHHVTQQQRCNLSNQIYLTSLGDNVVGFALVSDSLSLCPVISLYSMLV